MTKKIGRKILTNEIRRSRTWKNFWQQKLLELGIIPTGILFIIYIPYYVGKGLANIIGEDKLLLIKNFGNLLEDITFLEHSDFWSFGFLALLLVVLFILINWFLAKMRTDNQLDEEGYVDEDGYSY